MNLRIHTLGGLDISLDGEPLSGLKTRKAQALLVYLACHRGQRFSREHLQGLLWGDSDKKRAAASLRQVLSGLGRALPEGMLGLEKLDVWLDGQGGLWLDVALLDEQPEQYRGEFLHGFVAGDAPLWEEWLYSERERLRLFALDTFLGRGEALAAADPAAAIPFFRQALLLEPWRESTHQQLMRLYWRSGDRAAALRQYDECCRVLAEELDVEPSPETAELAERIHAGADPQPGNLPALGSQTPFTGRAEELARLDDLLHHSQLVTVTGAGGMGKSRLALEAARRRQSRYPDGVWFVGLESAEDADLVAPAIAAAVGLRFSGSAPPAEQLIAFLRRKQMLLLLDNYEQLLPATGLVDALLRAAPEVRLLVTSRQRLGLRMEQILPLAGLGESDAAAAFFVAAARRAQPEFDPAGQQAVLRRLCGVLEGMPLGLELAAAWLRIFSLPRIIEEIEASAAFLAAGHTDGPERQRSLEAVFASSWALLSGEEQAALARLPVFAGGFDLAAWRALTGAPVHRLLALAEKSLVQRDAGERFRLHERLRQFIGESHPDAAAAATHSRYYLGLLAGYEAQLSRGRVAEQQAIARSLQPDMENIRAAWEWAVGNGAWQPVGDGLESLFALYYQVLNRFDELIRLLEVAVAGVRAQASPEPALLCRLLTRLARVQTLSGDFGPALAAAQEALALARSQAAPALEAAVLARLGHIHQREGKPKEAVGYCRAALALAETHNLPLVAGDAHNILGILALLTSDYPLAEKHYRQSLALRRVHDSEINAVIALNNLAGLVDDETEKVGYINEVIAVSKAAGDRITWALSLSNRAQELDSRGEYRTAYGMFREAIGVLEPTGDEWLLGTFVLTNAATSARQMGYVDESTALALRALSLCRRLQAPRGEGMAFVQLAINAMLRDELDAAKEHLQTALAIFEPIGEAWWGAMAARRNWAIYCYLAGEPEEAERGFREALALDSAHNAEWGVITDCFWLARLAGERGDSDEARRLLADGLARIASSGLWELLAEGCVVLAAIGPVETAAPLLAWVAHHPLAAWPAQRRAEAIAARRGIRPDAAGKQLPQEREALLAWLRREVKRAGEVLN